MTCSTLIEVWTGCMFSGKTSKLIGLVKGLEGSSMKMQIFKPNFDTRYGVEASVVSHTGESVCATPVDPSKLLSIDPGTTLVVIDEFQFFTPWVVNQLVQLQKNGVTSWVFGLDLTFEGRPFGSMPDLLCAASKIHKLSGTCKICKGRAERTQRIVDSEDIVLVGGSEAYEPRCVICFRPY